MKDEDLKKKFGISDDGNSEREFWITLRRC